jgi:hypothetical protein
VIPIDDLIAKLTHPERQLNIEDDFESYKSEHVAFSRRIIRYAKPPFPESRKTPEISPEVSEVLAVIERYDTHRLVQRLSQEIIWLREELRWRETEFPDPIELYETVRLKREIIGCVDELADLVNATDDLMKYGIHDDDAEYTWNPLRREDIEWKVEQVRTDNNEVEDPSCAQTMPSKSHRKSKRVRARSNKIRVCVRRPRKRQPLSFRVLNSIRKTILVWSLAFKI